MRMLIIRCLVKELVLASLVCISSISAFLSVEAVLSHLRRIVFTLPRELPTPAPAPAIALDAAGQAFAVVVDPDEGAIVVRQCFTSRPLSLLRTCCGHTNTPYTTKVI